ncbi:Putative O-methyltransferase/MSMEI_4947 [Marinomonas gallaica]|uniref:O-methyltransferase/MSMEI_4947 n=1 Tax=Marinomonas gallaica TaxID=1806667 RepID=A0A1C3JTZ6_9GAMM|nr:class I SAM-dependent methyltransferase [Marinomonas gallaica]SBT18701.1 Putative O-methyltransferase/MSMEI_4947 [Marinomonas gallaica]SBT21656.1 Putative O-methyltransferase/MSMEI_4947 [Marinomonas gallaica]
MLPNFPKQVTESNSPVNRTVKVDDQLYNYIINHSVNEPAVLKGLRRETAQYHMARMALSPEVGQFLGLLITMQAPKRVLEIGVFTGYSTISMGLKLSKDAQLLALDKKQMWLDIANKYIDQAGLSSQVETRCCDAKTTMLQLQEEQPGTFDFIFIDADKANLLSYYNMGKALLRQGGCMVIDNTLWWGNVADESFDDKDTRIVRALNDRVHQDPEVTASLLPIGDGLTIIHKS